MISNYFYFDDAPISITKEIANGLSIHANHLNIKSFEYNIWSKQLSFLYKKQNYFDGLLLDWKLCGTNKNNQKVDYNVEALAQQLRTAIIEKKLNKDFPIILCSADSQFDKIYSKDTKRHNLFDLVVKKDDFNDKIEDVILQFIDLSNGYKILSKSSKITEIFDINESNIIDYRVLDYFNNLKVKPIHEIVRFILMDILNNTCFLINEYVLAARLGVDIFDDSDSISSWSILKEKYLVDSKYTGIFSNGWSRWWMPKIRQFWDSNFEDSLGSLKATERVKRLNEKFSLKLKNANTISKSTSEYFWTICKSTNRPLAIDDGILSSDSYNSVPWKEDEYYSFEAVLEGGVKQIHPLEKGKIEFLKKKFTRLR